MCTVSSVIVLCPKPCPPLYRGGQPANTTNIVTCEAPKSLQVDYSVATTKHAYATHIDSYPGQDLSAAAHGKDSGTILIVTELKGTERTLG